MANGPITNSNLYDRLEQLRKELTSDIKSNARDLKDDIHGLRTDFNTLEAGRLTKLEETLNKMQVNQGIANTNLYILWFIITTALTVLINIIVRTIK